MAGGAGFDLSADEIVRAAVEILHEQGLDAVSMRTVAARLGVSPVPLYSRVGNKEALLDAVADALLVDVAPPHAPGESWQEYTIRWASMLRDRLTQVPDIRRLVTMRRSPFVPAATRLVAILREDGGFSGKEAVEAVQLLSWATIGYAVLERPAGSPPSPQRLGRGRPDPSTVTREQADHLFDLHVKYLVQGLERDHPRR
ncbi:TetR/AcrR family transcriptional regulator [Cryptosporangium aurantiacum]|uniref:Transcriptional regulator, TetR family n=1 Tax=Cryptosporangium aurantiacum TaxID=134849 RepID=A0A1M7RGJ9_9ACTN|nr:TetR family transcriptional regulator [Cryptosporangium aurantiacum]SHN45168.1 transcriptional regulator, TetR family [Cryptosporangium aurantiacum]